MLAAGKDVPTVQTARKLSSVVMCVLSSCIIGSSFGSSTTCMRACRMSVWKSGASSDTSHWNWPVRSRVTPRSVTDVASDCVPCVCVRQEREIADGETKEKKDKWLSNNARDGRLRWQ